MLREDQRPGVVESGGADPVAPAPPDSGPAFVDGAEFCAGGVTAALAGGLPASTTTCEPTVTRW
jgi:hypothetical protein